MFIHNPFAGFLNGSLWTIRYEFYCYVGVAVAGLTGLLRWRWIIAAALGLSWIYKNLATQFPIQLYLANWVWATVFDVPRWIDLAEFFLAGMVVRPFYESIPYSKVLAGVATAIVFASLVTPWARECTLPIAGVYLLFYLACLPIDHLHHFGKFGDFSYGTYLHAFPIQQLLAMRWRGITPLKMFVIATPHFEEFGAGDGWDTCAVLT